MNEKGQTGGDVSSYWNWYTVCPYCDEEIDCHIEDNRAPDGCWYTAELPDECPLCDCRLVEDWDKLEMEAVEHYEEFHRTANKDEDWFEMVDWPKWKGIT